MATFTRDAIIEILKGTGFRVRAVTNDGATNFQIDLPKEKLGSLCFIEQAELFKSAIDTLKAAGYPVEYKDVWPRFKGKNRETGATEWVNWPHFWLNSPASARRAGVTSDEVQDIVKAALKEQARMFEAGGLFLKKVDVDAVCNMIDKAGAQTESAEEEDTSEQEALFSE